MSILRKSTQNFSKTCKIMIMGSLFLQRWNLWSKLYVEYFYFLSKIRAQIKNIGKSSNMRPIYLARSRVSMNLKYCLTITISYMQYLFSLTYLSKQPIKIYLVLLNKVIFIVLNWSNSVRKDHVDSENLDVEEICRLF